MHSDLYRAKSSCRASRSKLKPRHCTRASSPLHYQTPAPAPRPLINAHHKSQTEWLSLSMEPIILGLGQTEIHVLGICHHDPVNASLIASAMHGIQPSPPLQGGLLIALETSPTRLSILTKALRATPCYIQKTLSSLTANPPPPLSLSNSLSDEALGRWHQALDQALSSSFCLPIRQEDIQHHYLMGHPQYCEELAAIHLASSQSLPVIAIDLPVMHPLNEQASAFQFSGEVYEGIALDALDLNHGSSDEESSVGHLFRSWADELKGPITSSSSSSSSGATNRFQRSFILGVLSVSCLSPSMMDAYNRMDRDVNPLAFDVVVTQRNDFMSQQIVDLATLPSGLTRVLKYGLVNPAVGCNPPPTKILAIVGRSHARGIIDLLKAKR